MMPSRGPSTHRGRLSWEPQGPSGTRSCSSTDEGLEVPQDNTACWGHQGVSDRPGSLTRQADCTQCTPHPSTQEPEASQTLLVPPLDMCTFESRYRKLFTNYHLLTSTSINSDSDPDSPLCHMLGLSLCADSALTLRATPPTECRRRGDEVHREVASWANTSAASEGQVPERPGPPLPRACVSPLTARGHAAGQGTHTQGGRCPCGIQPWAPFLRPRALRPLPPAPPSSRCKMAKTLTPVVLWHPTMVRSPAQRPCLGGARPGCIGASRSPQTLSQPTNELTHLSSTAIPLPRPA